MNGHSAPQAGGTSAFFDNALVANYHGGSDELTLLKYIHEHPSIDQLRGNAKAIIDTMEEFAKTIPKGLMTIGPDKRDYIIKHVFAAQKPGPKVFVELGGYVGYSAIALASALVEHNSPHQIKYFSLEKNPLMAAVTSSFVELAGLKDVIQVCVGPAEASIKRLAAKGALQKEKVDFMLLDHWKDFYISDLQLCEELGLLHEGTVVMGDNIVFPGAPEYLAYVQQGRAERSSGGLKYRTKTEDFMLPFGGPDQLAVTTVLAG